MTFLFLRRKSRAVIDGAFITFWHDTHATAIVQYRAGRQIVRFAAEVLCPRGGGLALTVDVPDTMYSDEGNLIPPAEYEIIKDRVRRGLTKLGIAHDFESPEWRTQP
jgi:hypothetical protein